MNKYFVLISKNGNNRISDRKWESDKIAYYGRAIAESRKKELEHDKEPQTAILVVGKMDKWLFDGCWCKCCPKWLKEEFGWE